ncbi:MAG: carbamoyl-phosphate synthase large subunit [Verrucomicrobia bacterium]|nr:carbamoyl-phosphate synthase large subunit [Verrucomicrobiota bacterium]
MPRRTDIKSILIIGSGPIIIGQACEFDYSGVQACKALREEGYRVILINSNPATIMTDPEFADRTYVEPITPEVVELILAKEKPDALLPTLGGQTALNTAMALHESGALQRHKVKLIGAQVEAIRKGEDRQLFKDCMAKIGLECARSATAHTMEEARAGAAKIGTFPLIIRPAFTLGGTGGGVAYNREEFEKFAASGLDASPTSEILIEESLLGWKEYEMEVMRDHADNCVIVCSIENFDPMGVHTGDSITVAPAQTLTDREFQRMRDASFAVIREIGVETGGSNIQFAVCPRTGRMIVIEMNPRVSRSSALASKATGFPIAKIAAKLAVGYTLDELKNDITRETPASFEPTLDYVVTKIPRFTFEKFPGAEPVLTTSMKSVGEAMGIGRTFRESFMKALRSLDLKGLEGRLDLGTKTPPVPEDELVHQLRTPHPARLWYLSHALNRGWSVERIHEITRIDPWFLDNLQEITEITRRLEKETWLGNPSALPLLREGRQAGLSDVDLARLIPGPPEELLARTRTVRAWRKTQKLTPTYRLVDTCAAEFEAFTPYYYSTHDHDDDESRPTPKPKILILGGGPNRIGQGIEFDYCCVHASFALREDGFETIMVNSNPETVSTDYDTSDKLYFEPLTAEDVIHIYQAENRDDLVKGVIVQFGGQTPLNLASELQAAGVRILGTPVESIERAEDRKLFSAMLDKLGLRQPPNGTATTTEEALAAAKKIGFPLLLRPSFVLGGRAMRIVYSDDEIRTYMQECTEVAPGRPVLLDRFLEDATEVDVDCVADGKDAVIGAVMEHIEQAGIHSGDSACVIPSHSLPKKVIDEIRQATLALARELGVRGLMNIQFAVQKDIVYVLEVNPRASRTVPFVSKAIGKPLAKIAARVMSGQSLRELGFTSEIIPTHFSVKEAVFPFARFPGTDILLGPEMKSTGEVMGVDRSFGLAYAKSQMAAQPSLPKSGTVFLSVRDMDKNAAVQIGRGLHDLGFKIVSSTGTARKLTDAGIPVVPLLKLSEGRPNVVDLIKNREIVLVINTPAGAVARSEEVQIRTSALQNKIPVMTTVAAAQASLEGIKSLRSHGLSVRALQDYHS